MARLTPEQWAIVKQDRLSTGASFRELSPKYGVSDVAIAKRAKAEEWGDPVVSAKFANEKVSTEVSANFANQKKGRAKFAEGEAVPAKNRGGNPRIAQKTLSKRPPVIRNANPPKLEIGPLTEEQIAEAMEELSISEIAFVEAYLECFNGTRAWMQVHGTTKENTAAKAASDKLKVPKIRAYLARRMSAAFADSQGAKERLINVLQAAAYGDSNELVEYRREACRFCHGENHEYHYTPAEMKKAQAEATEEEPFDPAGGVGYDPRKEPHPDCPECHGAGRGRVMFNDSRNLSPAGLALYAGTKVGKDGIEIKMNSQERAREMLARTLKLYDDDKTTITINLDAATLGERFVTRMREAQERQMKVLQERGITPDSPDSNPD